MKKLLFVSAPLLLAACATAAGYKFADDPQDYGLYVASTDIAMDTVIAAKNAATGAVVTLHVRHMGDATGYIVESLPPGRYVFQSYTPNGLDDVPLTTPNGYFEVQANCFNYGGGYNFGVDAQGAPAYNDSVTLKDIELLPHSIRDYAKERDICAAGMGTPNERLSAADVRGQLNL